MSKVEGQLPSLIQGVSQQPPSIRQTTQLEACDNMYPDVAESLGRRNPSELVAELLGVDDCDTAEWFSPDGIERYLLLTKEQTLRVFTLDGTEVEVLTPSGTDYLLNHDSGDKLRFLPIGEYTFILNQSVIPEMSSTVSTPSPHEAIVFIKQGNYSQEYTLTVDGAVVATHTTHPSDVTQIYTNYIAEQLETELNTNLAGTFTVERKGHILYITNTAPFTIQAEDSNAGQNLGVVYASTADFTNIPVLCKAGVVIEVLNSEGTQADNYFVKFTTHDGSDFGDGYWKETAKPGLAHGFNADTMPHALQRNENGSFTFAPVEWTERQAGDEETNPIPSFVGKGLYNLCVHEGRLGFVLDSYKVLSDSGDLFSFFRSTVRTILDTDPIDVFALNTSLVQMRHAVSLDNHLVLFGLEQQFILHHDVGALSSKTVSLSRIPRLSCDPLCSPIQVGSSLMFAYSSGDTTVVRELFPTGDRNLYDSTSITDHVPRYLPRLRKLCLVESRQAVIAVPYNPGDSLYLYRWFKSENRLLQQAWSKWTFTDALVCSAHVFDDEIYLLIKRGDKLLLERVRLNTTDSDLNLPFPIYLDVKDTVSGGVYDVNTDETTFTLRIPHTDASHYILWDGEQIDEPRAIDNAVGSTSVKFLGDVSSSQLWYGVRQRWSWIPSTLYRQTRSVTGAPVTDTTGRLQVQNFALNYSQTGTFNVDVIPKHYYDVKQYVFSGIQADTHTSNLGQINISEGVFKVGVSQRNTEVDIEVWGDSWLPAKFTSAHWNGIYGKNR